MCCANVTVNALLRSCLGRARAAGCRAEVEADVPQKCPVDELDLCVILANAIENAVHACRRNKSPEDRWIRVRVTTHETGVTTLKLENPCGEEIAFGPDGLPKAGPSEEHGIGLKNVKAVVEQYGGVLSCGQRDGVFTLSAVLSPGRRRARPQRPAPPAELRGGRRCACFCAWFVSTACRSWPGPWRGCPSWAR